MDTIIFRTLGPWGSGKGADLNAAEVDNNFWSLAQAITDLTNNPAVPNGIESISVSGTQMTITLHDGTELGPYTLPVLTFRWRGEFDPGTVYAVLDVFTVTSGNTAVDPLTVRYGIFMVQIAGLYSTFNPDQLVDGLPVYLQLFGAVDTQLSTLSDVAIDQPPGSNPLVDGAVLVWNSTDEKWENANLGDMAYQNAANVLITGGQIHNMSAPVSPGDVANKAYVDALPAGMTIATGMMMANVTGTTGPALPTTLSNYLDFVLGATTRGTLLFRGGAGWIALAPGTAGLFLQSAGPGADLTWHVGGSGVTSITGGTGISTGGAPITAAGTVFLAAIADSNLLANASGVSAAPVPITLSALLDHVASNVRGSVLMRAGGGWVALAPGTSGYFLKTQGTGADVMWDAPAGSGTVTSVAAGTGLTTGGGPITGVGTISFGTTADSSLLANITGSTAAPVPTTLTLLLDHVLGTTQGALLYRSATGWVMLSPGTSGQILTTGGPAANLSWANAPASPAIGSQLILSNITGASAVPIGNTLSNIFDTVLGSTRGLLVFRGGTGWVTLAPGTAGQVLTTGGTGTDPAWAAGGGGGTAGGDLGSTYPNPTVVATHLTAPLPIAQGGTNAATAAAAATSLAVLPLAGGQLTGALTIPQGAVGTPSLNFAGGTTTGLFYSASAVNLTVGGTLKLTQGTAALALTTPMRVPDGTQAAPAYEFASENSSGIFRKSAGVVAMSVLNTEVMNWAGGVVVGAPTGGDKGAGTVNAVGVYAGGVLLTSDQRLKTDIAPLPDCLDLVRAIEPKQFKFIEPPPMPPSDEDTGLPPSGPPGWFEQRRWGFVAQDVERAMQGYDFGGHVTDEAGLQSLSYNDMVAVLWKAVQELTAKVKELEGR